MTKKTQENIFGAVVLAVIMCVAFEKCGSNRNREASTRTGNPNRSQTYQPSNRYSRSREAREAHDEADRVQRAHEAQVYQEWQKSERERRKANTGSTFGNPYQ